MATMVAMGRAQVNAYAHSTRADGRAARLAAGGYGTMGALPEEPLCGTAPLLPLVAGEGTDVLSPGVVDGVGVLARPPAGGRVAVPGAELDTLPPALVEPTLLAPLPAPNTDGELPVAALPVAPSEPVPVAPLPVAPAPVLLVPGVVPAPLLVAPLPTVLPETPMAPVDALPPVVLGENGGGVVGNEPGEGA